MPANHFQVFDLLADSVMLNYLRKDKIMIINKKTVNNRDIAIINSTELLITDVQSALDLIMSVKYETGCTDIAINKETFTEDFFILSTRLAGEILQKYINYGVRLAIYGDFSKYTSKPLKDFIYESNMGKDFYFQKNEELAVKMLAQY